MRYSSPVLASLDGSFQHLKTPLIDAPAAQRDPAVIKTVSEMLLDIQSRGIDAVLDYARALDRYQGGDIELSSAQIASSGDRLPAALRTAIELGSERTQAFARKQREHLKDFETELVPGLVTGSRYIPVSRVGAYLPAGRFPLTASAFMTVGVAKAAGVPTVIACTPPQPDRGANDAVVYAAHLSGVDRVFVLGGVQALAAMAYGLLGDLPVDMLVGAGNAFVAEAKRQLFGTVAIDLLAGPSEVAVISDETADPEIVAADLLGQAEHGPNSPAALVTTSEEHGRAVIAAVDTPARDPGHRGDRRSRLARLRRRHGREGPRDRGRADGRPGARAPRADHGRRRVVPRPAAQLRLVVHRPVEHRRLLRQGHGRHEPCAAHRRRGQALAGLSVSRFLKPLTYQRIAREATPELANAVQVISDSEGMAAHSATATRRLATYRG